MTKGGKMPKGVWYLLAGAAGVGLVVWFYSEREATVTAEPFTITYRGAGGGVLATGQGKIAAAFSSIPGLGFLGGLIGEPSKADAEGASAGRGT
jgi:hypothetical protein